MATNIHRLDQLLRYWEERCLIVDASNLCYYAMTGDPVIGKKITLLSEGPARFAQLFRSELKHAATKPFDHGRFLGNSKSALELNLQELGNAMYVPPFLWSWAGTSRRVVQLSEEIQSELSHTTLSGMTFDDLKWPFPTLAIQLAKPIKIMNEPCDLLIGSESLRESVDDVFPIKFMFVPIKLEHFALKPDELRLLREVTDRACPERKRRRAYSKVDKLRESYRLMICTTSVEGTDEPIEEAEVLGEDGDHPQGQTVKAAGRLFINTCLWLQSLPPSRKADNAWKELETKQRSPKPAAITNGARVFTLERTTTTSSAEHASRQPQERPTGTTGGTVSPHFRSGYWKRRPGSGNDPNAPKIIWVRPTIVHDELLEEGQLPAGTKQNIKP